MSDEKLAPISPERLVKELKRLSEGRKSGEYNADEYEHRFARMVSELRDRQIGGNRAEILAVLAPLQKDGTLDARAWERLTRSLGLV